MSITPPILPSEVLRRVRRVATMNGSAVFVISGILAAASLLAGDFTGAFAGLIIAGAGAMELCGLARLKSEPSKGCNLLVASQLYLLAAVLAYVGWKLTATESADMARTVAKAFREPPLDALVEASNLSQRELSQQAMGMYRIALMIVAALTTLHQGGMALYYHRRRHAVTKAVGAT
jgi:hypothetical protein